MAVDLRQAHQALVVADIVDRVIRLGGFAVEKRDRQRAQGIEKHVVRVEIIAEPPAARVQQFADDNRIALYFAYAQHPTLSAIVRVGEPVDQCPARMQHLNDETLALVTGVEPRPAVAAVQFGRGFRVWLVAKQVAGRIARKRPIVLQRPKARLIVAARFQCRCGSAAERNDRLRFVGCLHGDPEARNPDLQCARSQGGQGTAGIVYNDVHAACCTWCHLQQG